MRFSPKTADQVQAEQQSAFGVWPAGTYDFEIMEAEDTTSKAGNEMITLNVTIFDDKGKSRRIYDYLLEAMMYKLLHACEACGLLNQYHAGELHASHFIGQSGKCVVTVRPAKDGYPEKNAIGDYVVPVKKVEPGERLVDDEIPW